MSVTYIFQFVILFIFLFTAIMAYTINNSNAFGVKDEIVSIIEQNNGKYMDDGVLSEEIVDLIESTSYRTTGKCDDGYQGFARNGEMVLSSERASICIREVNATDGVDSYLNELLGADNVATEDSLRGVYYQIMVFYQLDLPIVKQYYNFSSKAETKVIYQARS